MAFSPASSWQTFRYNFKWEGYIHLFDGWLPRCALAVPLIGYLIIFNDAVVAYLSFEKITSNSVELFIFSSIDRLRFVYFGLIILGLSNVIYKWQRPWVHKIGKTEDEFVRYGLETFTPSDYLHFHGKIRSDGHYTRYGKYYDSEWEGFYKFAVGVEGRDPSEISPGDLYEARRKYESLLRGILRETFFRTSIQRRFWLSVCIVTALTGYVLLIMPSFDLFQVVVRSIFSSAGIEPSG